MGQALPRDAMLGGRCLGIGSSCWSIRNLRRHAFIKLPDLTILLRLVLCSSRPRLDHARTQFIVRDLFKQPRRKAL
jgi:hypothetical protein